MYILLSEDQQNAEKIMVQAMFSDAYVGDTPPEGMFHVASLPEAQPISGKVGAMYYNSVTKEFFYEYTDAPLTPEDEVSILKREKEELETRVTSLEIESAELTLANIELWETILAP